MHVFYGSMKSNIQSYLKRSTVMSTRDAIASPSPEQLRERGKRQVRAMDFIAGFIKFTYFSPDFEEGRTEYLNTCKGFLKRHSDYLGSFPYFSGGHISFADFMMCDFLDQLRTFEPSVLDSFKNITDFMARIEAIPAIKEFLDSDNFRNQPISDKMAHWETTPLPRY